MEADAKLNGMERPAIEGDSPVDESGTDLTVS